MLFLTCCQLQSFLELNIMHQISDMSYMTYDTLPLKRKKSYFTQSHSAKYLLLHQSSHCYLGMSRSVQYVVWDTAEMCIDLLLAAVSIICVMGNVTQCSFSRSWQGECNSQIFSDLAAFNFLGHILLLILRWKIKHNDSKMSCYAQNQVTWCTSAMFFIF